MHRFLHRNKLQTCRIPALLAGLLLAVVLGPVSAHAAESGVYYTNPDTGYEVLLQDGSDLILDEDVSSVVEKMIPATSYGNAIFVSTDSIGGERDTLTYAEGWYHTNFGSQNGSMLIINMGDRVLSVYNEGENYAMIRNSDSNLITDNIYRYASRGDYKGCIQEAFAEITAKLSGRRIPQTMKYISNGLLALLLALFLNLGLVHILTGRHKASKTELLGGGTHSIQVTNASAKLVNQSKRYSPVERSSGGGGGSRGGFGGGGHSGGGGSHRF